MVKTILRSPKLSKKGSFKCNLVFIATVLVALVESSQVQAFSSIGLATRVLTHRGLPQYLFDIPSNVRYSRYTHENSDVADDSNSMELMEELPMKRSKFYVSSIC